MRSQLTPETRATIIASVRVGLTLAEAAEQANVSSQLLRNWLAKGRIEEGTPHAEFARQVDEARAAARSCELTEREFRERLDRAVRAGSIQALRLWWSVHREDEEDRPPDALDALRARHERRRSAHVNGNGDAAGSSQKPEGDGGT